MEQLLQQVYLQELYDQVEAYAATQCQGCYFLQPNKLLHSCIHWSFLDKYSSYINHGEGVNEDKIVKLAMSVHKDLQLSGDLSMEKCLELVRLFKQVNLMQLFLPVDGRVFSLINEAKMKQVIEDVGQGDVHLNISPAEKCDGHNDSKGVHLLKPEDL